MNQYIITEDEVKSSVNVLRKSGHAPMAVMLDGLVRSRPYNPQAEREKVLDELIRLLEIQSKTCDDLCGETDNITTATGWAARAGQCNEVIRWIEKLREGKDGE